MNSLNQNKDVKVNVEGAENSQQAAVAEKPQRRISNHIFHPSCQELISLLEKIDINAATVIRGQKNLQEVKLITDKEIELIETFKSTDFNIKRTGDVLGCSHTNVWQRLYGNGKNAKGVLGKLREYAEGKYMTQMPEQPAEPTQNTEGEQAAV